MTDIEDRILRLVRNELGITGGAIAVRMGWAATDTVAQFDVLYGLNDRGLLRWEWRMQAGLPVTGRLGKVMR